MGACTQNVVYERKDNFKKEVEKNKSFPFLGNSEMQGKHFVRGRVLGEQEFKGKKLQSH